MQVDVHRIDAEIARAHPADDRVEIRAVAIDVTARRVHRVRDRLHVALEQAAGVGIGDHHPGDVRPQPRLERLQVDAAVLGGRNVLDRKAGKGGGGRVGAVRAGRHEQDLAVLLALRIERRTNREDAAQLAMRAGLGAHRHGLHAGERDQPVGELVDHLKRALHRVYGRERVDVGEARQARHPLVEARIVLHRARAEREQAQVDRIVLTAEARIVAHRLRLGQAGQTDLARTLEPAETRGPPGRFAEIDAGSLGRADLEDERLLEHQRAVAGEGRKIAGLARFRSGGAPAGLVDRAHASTS